MTRSLTVSVEGAALCASSEEGESFGVEEGPAVCGQAHVLERGAAVQRLRCREEPVPDEVRGVERLLALGLRPGIERVEPVGEAVSLLEQLTLRQKPALLREEQEHDPHEDGDDGLVDEVTVIRKGVQITARPSIGRPFGEGLNDKFNGLADLDAKGLGDLFGSEDRLA